jgi:NitT/TauT family transport system substrate-binding protein
LKRLAIVVVLFALSCAQKPETPVTRAKVRLNINQTLTYGPIMIAKDEGFFDAEGIDAELVSLDSNSAVTAAVAGKLDVLSVGLRAGVFNMILKGAPLQIVADRGHSDPQRCSVDAFIAPIALVKKIEAADGDLRGQRIAMIRGGVMEFLTMRLLEQRGLTANDIVMLQLPQGTPISSRDELEAVRFTSEPALSSALTEGWAGIIATADSVEPSHQNALLVYGKRLLHDDPELGRRFMRAYLRGVRRFNKGKTESNVAILSRYTKLPPDVIRRACWIAIANDGHIDPKTLQPFLDWALAENYLDAPAPVEKWWNPSFLESR